LTSGSRHPEVFLGCDVREFL